VYDHTPAIWTIWPQLAFIFRLYWLILSFVSIYTLLSAASIARRLRSIGDGHQLTARVENLRQLIGAAFYLFGLLFFWTLPSATSWPGVSKTLPLGEIFGTFSLQFAFATNVFFVLLVLHSTQWFVSGRIRALKDEIRPPA
jgi:hypothetical protein